MTLEKVVLLPHPPIALPEVAGSDFPRVEKTAQGMQAIAKDILESNSDTLIVITPHASIHPHSFTVFSDPVINGSFANFRAPQVVFKLNNNLDIMDKIIKAREEENLNDVILMKPGTPLDHGSGVPLYYIYQAGFNGSVVIFNYSFGSIAKHQNFGKTLFRVAENCSNKITLVASGDLSHRVIKGAPAGYHPDGEKFDAFINESIKEGQYEAITQISTGLRENAGECAYNSLMVALGALDNKPKQNKIYSYEAPFGVGYLVASL